MSYLLDALKKAEQERLAAEMAVDSPIQAPVSTASLPGWLVLIVLAFLVITIIKLFSTDSQVMPFAEQTAEQEAKQTAEPIVQSVRAPASANTQENIQNKLQENVPLTDSEQVVIKPVIVPEDFSLQKPKIFQLGELPKDVLDLIPTISLESHIYSSAAQYRSVVINERTFNEGMYISNQVVLQEITSTGIVINVAGRQIALAKGVSWVSAKHVK